SHRWWCASTRTAGWSDTGGPHGSVRVGVLLQGVRVHLGAQAGRGGGDVPAVDDAYRIDEVLVQVIDVLDDPVGHRGGNRDEVEHRQVLDHFAQPDTAGV